MRFIYLIFFILPFGVFAQSIDCSKFKTGTFKYPNNDDWIITRNDSIQIEIDKKNNLKFVGIIDWVSNCQYTLTYKEVNNPARNPIIGTSFKVTINTVKDNKYTYTAYDDTRKMDGEIIKVKE